MRYEKTNANVIALPVPEGQGKPKRKRKTKRSQGSVYERNGRWYLKFRVTDPATRIQSRKTEPIDGATSRAEALLALEKRLATIADGSYFKRANLRPLMFDDVAEEFVAWARTEKKGPEQYEIAIENARALFGGKPLASMTLGALESLRTRLVQSFVAKRFAKRGGKVSDEERRAFVASARATCNRRITVLRRMFNRLVELDRLPEAANPFKRGKLKPYSEAENARTRYYSPEEIARILTASTEPFRSFVGLALNTGLRKSEILNLKPEDWDEASNTVRARFTKCGKPRSVPVNSIATEILERLRSDANGPYLFHDEAGKRLSGNWVTMAWRRVCRRAGLENARLHDCRHSMASHLVNRGVPLFEVQKILGHSTLRLTERYSHLAKGTLHEAAEAMSDVYRIARGLQAGLQEARPPRGRKRKPAKGLIGAPGFEPGTSTVSRETGIAE